MYITENSLITIAQSKKARMGLAYSKKCDAPFLSRYFNDCTIRLKDICYIQKGSPITEDSTEEGEIPVVAGGKEAAYYHSISNRKGNVITISASGANSGYVNYWGQDIWASDCITVVSKDETRYSTKFLYHLLLLIQDDIYLMQIGADQPHVYADDIQDIKVPEIPYPVQQKALSSIAGLEDRIKDLQLEKNIGIKRIISNTFENYFNYDYKSFNVLRNQKIYQSSFSSYGNNRDARFSPKFHRPAGEFAYKELTSRPYKPIKSCLELIMITGQGISPKDYDDNGEYAYISMADISTWELKTENIKYVSNQYAKEHLTKKPTGYSEEVSTTTQINDIVMMRSGEGGIGKVAIVKNDIKAIFCDFLIRMRFNKNIINPDFAYYYFRTDYFQYLIECHKKGLGNNTNIFPNQLQNFPIPDLSLEEQQHIVDLIDKEINKQKELDKQVNEIKSIINHKILEIVA